MLHHAAGNKLGALALFDMAAWERTPSIDAYRIAGASMVCPRLVCSLLEWDIRQCNAVGRVCMGAHVWSLLMSCQFILSVLCPDQH